MAEETNELVKEPGTTALEGKRILLTGGTTGIGRATLLALLERGAHVLTYGRHREELDEALDEGGRVGRGRLFGHLADQARHEDLLEIFRRVDEELGGLDILINNAAIGAGDIASSSYDDWHYAIQTNLVGYMDCTSLAVERLAKEGGHIVNVGSLSADVREEGSSVYVAAKAAIQGFSEALRKEVNDRGIRVSLIEPGLVGTDMTTEKASPTEQPEKEEKGEMLMAEDIAACILYCLTQPARCEVIDVKIRPHRQKI